MPSLLFTYLIFYKMIKRRFFARPDRHKSRDAPQITVTLTSSLASSSIKALSRSLVLSESCEMITVILISFTYLAFTSPKNLLDAYMACTEMSGSASLVFWFSMANEIGCTLIVPLIFLAIHPKLRSPCPPCWSSGGDGPQHENIYLSAIPSTSRGLTSETAITVM